MELLPTDLKNIIYKMKISMYVHEVNKQILEINPLRFKADDIFCHNTYNNDSFWDTDHNVKVIRYDNLKLKSTNLDYITSRYLGGIQWTYICGDCGEFLKLSENKNVTFNCKCCDYIY